MIIRMIIAFFILSVVSFTSVAGELTYTGKVIHVYELDNDGSLKTSDLEEQYKGSHFIISRVTGEIIGNVVPTLLAGSTKVINKGNNEYPFKSIAHLGNQVQLIEIQEFVPEENKPFIAISMDGAGIITGLCN